MQVDMFQLKQRAFELLTQRVEADAEALSQSQAKVQAGAVHEETRAEDPKDTRATEASYLARGLAERAETLRQARLQLAAFELRRFTQEDTVALGALVELEESEGATQLYLLVPAGAGEKLEVGEHSVRAVTASSPLGARVLGLGLGDDVQLPRPKGAIAATLSGIW